MAWREDSTQKVPATKVPDCTLCMGSEFIGLCPFPLCPAILVWLCVTYLRLCDPLLLFGLPTIS